jgi:lipoprotein NlpD
VEDQGRGAAAANGAGASAPAARTLPGAENAGKPGYYTVKPGDTLIRIALESGQNWRDIAAWNGLDNPNLIEVGQVVRIVPPVSSDGGGAVAARPVSTPRIEARGLDNKPVPAGKAASSTSASSTGAGAAASNPAGSGAGVPATAAAGSAGATGTPAATSAAAQGQDAAADAEEPNWSWPSGGPVIGGFEEGKRKGLTIGGKAGDPVVASADGRVVYAGSGLRGYGNLVIIKHGGDYLTAYAHNQALLVKEDQVVKRGQKIAEMGSTDAERVQLHFEIRKKGKPLDPARQLPSR